MYEEPSAVMTVGEQFVVDVVLRQRSALMPLCFKMVTKLISGNLSEHEVLKIYCMLTT